MAPLDETLRHSIDNVSYRLVTTDITYFVTNVKRFGAFSDLTNKYDDLWISVRENLKSKQNNKGSDLTVNSPRTSKYPHR